MSFPTPVLLGADLNCYQLARLLHEDYGVSSHAFGRYALSETGHSRILHFRAIPNLWEEDVLLSVLRAFSKTHKDALLFGCTDAYVRMIVKHRDELASCFRIPYGDMGFFTLASDKRAFGDLLAAQGIPTPKTTVLDVDTDLSRLSFPQVLKPAISSEYYAHPFIGMKKAYLVQDTSEAQALYTTIRAAGYKGAILLQDYIPGEDTAMYVANGYVDRDGNLRQLAIGHVLLQWHTPNGIGNPCAILTERFPALEALAARVAKVAQVRGLFNLDIRYDKRDNTYKVLECNPRQGRSAYSTQVAGLSPIRSVVDELVFDRPYTETRFPTTVGYWHSVPDRIVKRHLAPPLQRAIRHAGKRGETLRYRFDLKRNYKRKGSLLLRNLSHLRKFYMYDKNRSASL